MQTDRHPNGLGQLETAGARIIDCHISDCRPPNHLQNLRDGRRMENNPSRRNTQNGSVSQAFDKLLGLRTDVEQALAKAHGKAGESALQPAAAQTAKPLPAAKKPAAESTGPNANAKAKERSSHLLRRHRMPLECWILKTARSRSGSN